MNRKNGRNAAVQALLRTDESGGYSNIVIDRVIEDYSLDPREAAFASSLFYGVLERRITLDYILDRYSRRGIDKTDPAAREILRTALYQLLYMERIPQSAAVNEAGESAKAFGIKSLVPFINGVLRNFIRSGKEYELPKDRAEAMSVRYSLPKWLIRHFERDYGKDVARLYFESLLDAPPVYLRVNSFRTTDDNLIEILRQSGIEAEKTSLPGALRTLSQGNLTALKAFSDGLFHIQDLSSQLACSMLEPPYGAVLMDVCSAPGGKAFTLSQIIGETGRVYAHDLYPGRVSLIRSGAERLGISNIEASVRDAQNADDGVLCDAILADVPCSGLGVLRRKPEIRYKDPISLRDLPALQYAILEHSASFLKPGGSLMYSTCTLSRRENGAVVAEFLKNNRDFEPEPLHIPLGFTRTLEEPENEFTMFPHQNGTDGFFAAKLRRKA